LSKNIKIAAGVLLIITVILAVIVIQPKRQLQNIQHIKADELLPYLNDGDIICRLSGRIWSLFIRDLSPAEKRFSHLGIVRIRNNAVTVINAEGLQEGDDIVSEVSLEKFLEPALSAGIFRLHNIDTSLISDTAMEFTGRPFDWKFDMDEDEYIYCTELLYVVLKKLDPSIKLNTVWIKEFGRYILPLDICSQSEYFTEIKYLGI